MVSSSSTVVQRTTISFFCDCATLLITRVMVGSPLISKSAFLGSRLEPVRTVINIAFINLNGEKLYLPKSAKCRVFFRIELSRLLQVGFQFLLIVIFNQLCICIEKSFVEFIVRQFGKIHCKKI